MKKYTFTTKDVKGNEIETYVTEQYNLKEAKRYAKLIIAESMQNERSHSRITLA